MTFMWIDSHCHLTHARLLEHADPDAVVARARDAGISGFLNVCCKISEDRASLAELSARHESLWYTLGTHPHDAGDPQEQAITQEALTEAVLADPKIIGIGESGLDYYYDHSSREDQQGSFRKHIRSCLDCDVPLVVHARDADEDVIRILREEGAGGKLRGVLHCFSSGRQMAMEALDLGFYISFSGILTFRKSEELREIACDIPLDRLLVETDSPYLAPEPCRNQKINEPALVVHTGKVLAELHKLSPEAMAEATTRNFFTLFSRAQSA